MLVVPTRTWVLSLACLAGFVVLTACSSGIPADRFTLDVAIDGNGSVISSPAGIDCPDDCSESYSGGTSVTLTVTPGSNSAFTSWGGACASSTGESCTLVVDSSLSATATFSPADGANGDLEESLNTLGVDTTKTGRVDAEQDPLPDSYSPLGASASFGESEEFSDDSNANKTDELFVVGLPLPDEVSSELTLLEQEGVQIGGDGSIDPGTTSVLHSLSDAANPWVDDESGAWAQSDNGRTLRAAAAGDVDNDGFEEMVVAFVDTSTAETRLTLKIIEDAEENYAETEAVFADGDGVLDVAVATPDLDGDGASDVVVAVGRADSAELLFLRESSGGYETDDTRTKGFAAAISGSQMTVEMSGGNLDFDNPHELIVVVNELDTSVGPPVGSARYFVYDDGAAGLAELDSGDVQGRDGALYTAQVADVSSGDIDGDGLGEILLGGLTEFHTDCQTYTGIVTVLDDAERSFEALSSKKLDILFNQCPAFSPWRLRFIHVNAFDLDGDGIDEVQAGQDVFASLSEGRTLTGEDQPIHSIPDGVFFEGGGDAGAYLTTNTSDIVTGDVTGDGRENILVYHQWQADIRIWGLSAVEEVGFAELSRVSTPEYNTQENVRPILLPVNVDADSPVLKYSEGEYELVWTEPIVIAALAAAPCAEGIGQNTGACATTFGNSESTTISNEVTVSVNAKAYVGVKTAVNVPWVGEVGTDFKATISRTASRCTGTAYTVEKSQVFTSGPLEDSIVFTSIPYDRYVYTILSHPDPEMVGGTVEVLLPREPILLKVEREFYNQNIVSTAAIGSNVFDHTVGDLASYPNTTRKNQLLTQYGGLENGPLSVGQGTGSEGLAISVSTAVSEGSSLAIEAEVSVDVTAGPVLAGFSLGYGETSSLTVTSGEQTTYGGTVGDLSAETFTENQYSFGIFTYVQELDDQEFEVINFWVQ